jgi:superfamily II DNA or RNA helicase
VQNRKWQDRHFQAFLEVVGKGKKVFSLEATMGAGKSHMAAMLGTEMIDNHGHDFVLVVVPWDSIRGNEFSGMMKAFDFGCDHVRDSLFLSGNRVHQPLPRRTAFVVTYQAVCNQSVVDLLREWKKKKAKFTVIFDEVHHTSTNGGQWGEYAAAIHDLADMTVTMSGTYFRTDGQKIRFLEYDDNGRPVLSCAGYTYSEAVADEVCRPVTFRYVDPVCRCHDKKKGDESHTLSAVDSNDRRFGAIRAEVLDPQGECVRELISQSHGFMDGIRRKFPDAGFLFTCPPGVSNEDRYVHQITAKVREITREDVVEVVSSDRDAAGKLEYFRRGTVPYLVAINKVSEGVDIPRLRGVGMLRYTDSEMLFRQVVGRALRMTDHEDGTAAGVFMPKFRRMYEFAVNMYGEAMTGIRDLQCPQCGQYPCVCPCLACHESPCVCPPRNCLPPDSNEFSVLDVEVQAGGGSVGNDDVLEASIALAERVKADHISHRHNNVVQLAHAIQVARAMSSEAAGGGKVGGMARLEQLNRRVHWLMNRIVPRYFGGSFDAAWVAVLHKRHNTDWKTAKVTWSNQQIEGFVLELETILKEGVR